MVGDTTGATLYVVNDSGVEVLTQNPGTGQLSSAKLSGFKFTTGATVISSAFGK
ncbi:hypothetical protein GALL_344210 [mine drainage metagenome]|uniref:Uncharacterized protein n=1 Tax=mine drainage metagenome TaxID=410659 RepID=A0A1J5QV77_9ZZZZ